MLTIKQITDDREAVIRALEKKHFKGAAQARPLTPFLPQIRNVRPLRPNWIIFLPK